MEKNELYYIVKKFASDFIQIGVKSHVIIDLWPVFIRVLVQPSAPTIIQLLYSCNRLDVRVRTI